MVDEFLLKLDSELFDLLCRLPFVKNDTIGQAEAVHVEVDLTEVGSERVLDPVPESVDADLFLVVLRKEFRRLVPKSSDTDRLDFQNSASRLVVDDAISMPKKVILGVGDRYLSVSDIPTRTGRTLRRGNPVPLLRTGSAFPVALDDPGAPQPVLPLVVDVVPLGKDVESLEVQRLVGALPILDDVPRRTWAPVFLGHLTRMEELGVTVSGVGDGITDQVSLYLRENTTLVEGRFLVVLEEPVTCHG